VLQQIVEDRRLQVEGNIDINAHHHVHFDKSREMDMTDEKNILACEDYCSEQFISTLTSYGKNG
jgi:hypothetical protein